MRRILSKENRALLAELVRTDFKLRYKGSILGYAWSLLKPMTLFAILYVVFVKFLKIGSDIPHFPIYLLLGIVLWTFFGEMTALSLNSIVGRGDLIRKIRIPRWIIVISASITALINLFLNLLVVLVFMLINKTDLLVTSLWIPLIIIEIYIFALGISFFLATAYVKYRDTDHIWEVVLQGAFYITPILYPLTLIKNVDYQKILLINPMAQAIQDARYALVTHHPHNITIARAFGSASYRLIPLSICVLVFVVGILYFRRESKHFAENL